MALMPVLFIGHGTPMNALEKNQFSLDWLELNKTTPYPKAILCISAHWETAATRITAHTRPPTIHDFSGFPQSLFDTQYPCPGDPKLAEEITSKVDDFDIQLDHQWGLDHGSWVVLKHLYPNADVPVLQLSIDYRLTLAQHYQLAQQLAFLRAQQVLVMGSGNIVHNIQKWRQAPDGPIDWAKNFNQQVMAAIIANDHQALINYQRWQPEARDAVPTDEHYIPLIYALGLRNAQDDIQFSAFTDETLETCSMTSLRIG